MFDELFTYQYIYWNAGKCRKCQFWVLCGYCLFWGNINTWLSHTHVLMYCPHEMCLGVKAHMQVICQLLSSQTGNMTRVITSFEISLLKPELWCCSCRNQMCDWLCWSPFHPHGVLCHGLSSHQPVCTSLWNWTGTTKPWEQILFYLGPPLWRQIYAKINKKFNVWKNMHTS